jgi:hypothetical protein
MSANIQIRNRERARQIIRFDGMAYGEKAYPTDIDAMIEWKDKCYVFIEAKFGDAPHPVGQKLLAERMTRALSAAGKHSLYLVARHSVPPEQDVILADCLVHEYWFDGNWKETHPENRPTVKFWTSMFLRKYGEY